jgi:hypothetical protein
MDYPIAEVEADAIDCAMAILPPGMDSAEARVMLRAIALQESRMTHRYQVIDGGGKGPARGLWQFERGGGVKGVLTHPASKRIAQSVCLARGVPADPRSVWQALETDDVLAAGFARLLLYTDPAPLPAIGDVSGSWEYYTRIWRPGKPHFKTWPDLYGRALRFMVAA